jgi:predicted HD phosphohydrolase
MSDIVDRIVHWFALHGHGHGGGGRGEPVGPLEHALQCAQLAEFAHAERELVVAALLHDVGHVAGHEASRDDLSEADETDDGHEMRAAAVLSPFFEPAVVEPIRLHVEAKRYLTAVDPSYLAHLSPSSLHSLALQGGPMTFAERRRFELLPFADEAVLLRRWDDLARAPGRATPPLDYYLALVGEILAADREATALRT